MNFYSEQTHHSKNMLRRLFHKRRFACAFALLESFNWQKFLDFGCGDGFLLAQIAQKFNDKQIYGFEPADNMRELTHSKLPNVEVFTRHEEFSKMHFDAITVLEVFEHLPETELYQALATINTICDEKGKIIVGVPIEIGLVGALKNVFRRVFFGKNVPWGNIFALAFGKSVARETPKNFGGVNYIHGHIGFDYRELEKILRTYFKVCDKKFSPFAWNNRFLNSTVFFVCARKCN